MYSRNFGGVRSDGQLKDLEKNWGKGYTEQNYGYEQKGQPAQAIPVSAPVRDYEAQPAQKKLLNFNLDFLKNIQIDDLILIGIGILLLLDSDASNDMLIILIAMMLFF